MPRKGRRKEITDVEAPPLKRAKVLDEDEYVEAIGTIIERDFYPDLPDLRDSAAFIDANDRKDYVELRDIDERTRLRSMKEEDTSGIADTSLSLDEFLATHTSEDADAFKEIMEAENLARRKQYAWMYKAEEEANKHRQLMLEAPPDSRPSGLITWPFKAKNALMYDPDGLGTLARDAEKEIKRHNTRFKSRATHQPDGGLLAAAPTPLRAVMQSIGDDGAKVKVNVEKDEYEYVSAPAPDTSEPPAMTWGVAAATPVAIERNFALQVPRRREALAERLGKVRRARKMAKTPTATPHTPAQRLAALTPAARRLVERQKDATTQSLGLTPFRK